jgi:hypothetical protein
MGSIWSRIRLACAAFFTILFKGRLPTSLQAAVRAAAPVEAPIVKPLSEDRADRAVQLLALFQRDGRLIDFLMEDLGGYGDAEIGAAVRDVHAGCRRVLEKYVTLQSILTGQEGGPITMGRDIDPAAVRLVGNVTGRPPFRGTLLHRGWRATSLDLPPLGDVSSRAIVAQAEVEVA